MSDHKLFGALSETVSYKKKETILPSGRTKNFVYYIHRGVLQNELSALTPFLRYPLIGLFWYVWHLSFLSAETSLPEELAFLGLFIGLSWGIGQIAAKIPLCLCLLSPHRECRFFFAVAGPGLQSDKKWLPVILLIGLGIVLVNIKTTKPIHK